ncbi:MAG: hypothetical protein ACRCXA_11095 [Peptostreptococcaceae bacterium]
MKKIRQILIMSLMICFFVTSMLFVSNIIMGVVVGFRYYFMLFGFGSLALFATLFLCNINRIFAKKRKISKVKVSKKAVKTNKQNPNVSRRKVS